MKILFASDIHGSAYYCRRLLDIYKETKASRMVILGDILYHGPRNDLPKEYAPKEVAMQIERNGIVENLKMAIETVMDNPVERRKMSEASEKRAKDFTRSRFYNSYLKVFE